MMIDVSICPVCHREWFNLFFDNLPVCPTCHTATVDESTSAAIDRIGKKEYDNEGR